jgi:hypothetical protein
MLCVPEVKHMIEHRTLEIHAASPTSNATDMTVIAVAVTTGLILVACVISVVIALARKRGLAQNRGMFSIQQAGMRCQIGCVVWWLWNECMLPMRYIW